MIFVKLDDQGDIRLIKDIPKGQPLPRGEGWIEISHLEYSEYLPDQPKRFVLDLDEEGKPLCLRMKKEIRILVKKRFIEPNGEDTARIEFEMPDDVDNIDVEISGISKLPRTIVNVKKGEPVEFTSDSIDLIRLRLVKDKELYTDDSENYVLARNKGIKRDPFRLERFLSANRTRERLLDGSSR